VGDASGLAVLSCLASSHWLFFFQRPAEVVGMPISEVVGGGFDQPAFSFNESAGFLPTQSAIPRQYLLFEKYISEWHQDRILKQNLNKN